jgi:hypothetical protein
MKDISKILSICIKNDIKVYPVIYDEYHLKVEVDYAGRKKKGKEKYKWRTEQKQLQAKIIELYETIAKRIQDRE